MIHKLDWDSRFFGLNIATVTNPEILNEELRNFIQSNRIDFIQALCSIDEVFRIKNLECNSFHFADLKMTYKVSLLNSKEAIPSSIYEIATMEDKQYICNIAESSFIDSRYYGYEHIFKSEKVNEMYSLWAGKSIEGQFDDYCLKIVKYNKPVGFITVKIKNSSTAVIGIFAVDDEFRGKGVGGQLMQSLFSFLMSLNINEVEVSTQGKNIPAQNFYIKHGFRVSNVESWYYRCSGKLDF